MTLDELQRRDARIAELEAIRSRHRTPAQQDELGALHAAQDSHRRRLPAALERRRRRLAELETYARQTGFGFLLEQPA